MISGCVEIKVLRAGKKLGNVLSPNELFSRGPKRGKGGIGGGN